MTKLIFSSINILLFATALTAQEPASVLEDRQRAPQSIQINKDQPFQSPMGGGAEIELMEFCANCKINVNWPNLRKVLYNNAHEDFKAFRGKIRWHTLISYEDLDKLEELIKKMQSFYQLYRERLLLTDSQPEAVGAGQTLRSRSDSEGSASDLSALSVSFTDSEPDSDDSHLSEDDPLLEEGLRQRLNATMG